MMTPFLRTLLVVLFGILSATSSADEISASVADPEQTRLALVALLSVANEPIPKRSSCMADYGQAGRPRVKHLIAMRLSPFYAGENEVRGMCNGSSCTLHIYHARDEDVSGAEIRFRARGGRAEVASLDCVMTP